MTSGPYQLEEYWSRVRPDRGSAAAPAARPVVIWEGHATRRLGLSSAALVLCLATTAVHAHHSFGMFDRSKEEVLRGDVVRWAFNSPHTLLYIRDAKGTVWGFEGAAPPAVIERTPKVDGFTFKPGDKVTMIHCPLRDGRSGGAIGIVVTSDGTWYTPNDGGCGPNVANWRKWLEAGYTSRAQAEAATKK